MAVALHGSRQKLMVAVEAGLKIVREVLNISDAITEAGFRGWLMGIQLFPALGTGFRPRWRLLSAGSN